MGGVADSDVDEPSSSQSTEAWDALEAEEDELDESSEATAPMYEETYPAGSQNTERPHNAATHSWLPAVMMAAVVASMVTAGSAWNGGS